MSGRAQLAPTMQGAEIRPQRTQDAVQSRSERDRWTFYETINSLEMKT
jgi:hypothetical protein